jgi:deazaflavin-dependent oxidoreductase (nitroreductase family)
MANALVDRSWPAIRWLMGGHTTAYRATGGLIGHHVPGAPPMLLLDHVGAKSGTLRTSPLAYLRDGDSFVIVASKGGYPRNPGWYHNLVANPDTTIQVGSKRSAVHARVANPEERARLWPKVVELYSGYRGYQERTDREIPLVILEPRGGER